MATSTPLQIIKPTARKLPIKRKPTSQPLPNHNPKPKSIPFTSDSDPDAEYEYEEPAENDGKQPPFKFHRIWPESDEIRFLQGLLGCWSQGMLFPRDLNLFYDRFSESMPQPYTRSQLSEKLRRLRKKFRTMASRIARGHSASRLSQHDRDLLHLSTRLWDPSHASTSPFSPSLESSAPAGTNRRRRPNPRAPTLRALEIAPPADDGRHSVDPPAPHGHNGFMDGADGVASQEETPDEAPSSSLEEKIEAKHHLPMKSVLDVFDVALNETRTILPGQGSDDALMQGSEMKDLSRRWQEQRLAELNLLSRRWRLVIEQEMQI